MPRPRTRDSRIYWRNGRAYADFRDFAAWGGRQEALKEPDAAQATTDPAEAELAAARRLTALLELRKAHPNGLPTATDDPLDRLAPFVAHHLAAKRAVEEERRNGERWLAQQKRALKHAARFMQARGRERLREIGTADVQAWLVDLAEHPPTEGRPLSASTRGKWAGALNNLFRRAISEERVERNPVAALMDKPRGGKSRTPFMEIPDAALFLEACRRFDRGAGGAIPFLYELVATYLLTGGRGSEVTGLRIEDVDFARDLVWFRRHELRPSLKNEGSARAVPLFPQLREILQAYLARKDAPAGPLLFPAVRGARKREGLLSDFRRALDGAASLAGIPRSLARRKVFRVTWISARLQTLDNGAPISPFTVTREAGHRSLKMVEEVYGRLGAVRQRREHVEYRWSEWEASLGHRLQPDALPERYAAVLAALPAKGATAKEWMRAAGVPVGTYYYIRDRLLERGLILRDGEGRGSRFRRTGAGDLAIPPG
jgi:integrase